MIFYKHFIGDYQRKTNRLSILEDGVYRRLLDEYYANESPLPLEKDSCFRLVRAIKPVERKAVLKILSLYFTKTPDGYTQTRAAEQIVEYKGKSEKASRSSRARWDTNAAETDMRTDMRTDTRTDMLARSQKPEATNQNQKPIKPETPVRVPGRSTAKSILDHWNTLDALTSHRALTEKAAASINALLNAGYSEADLCKAITRYAELCQQGTAPGYNRWSLALLMSREEGGWLDKMLDPKYEGITHETANDRRRKRNAEVLGFDSKIPRLDGGDTL